MQVRNTLFSLAIVSHLQGFLRRDPGANHAEEALNGRNKTRRKVRITHGGKMLEMRTANVEYIFM